MYRYPGGSYDPGIDADIVTVKQHGKGNRAANQQPSIAIDSEGTWVASWTQATAEAAKDESVVCARSYDGGQTWSDEVDIERAWEGRTASWAMMFCVPHTGRFYAFFWWSENANPLRDAGHIYFRYSDERGANWSKRYQIPMTRHAMDVEGCDSHGWNTGFPILTGDGGMLMGFSKIAPQGQTSQGPCGVGAPPQRWHTEVFFLRAENILEEDNPEKLQFTIRPEGPEGLWVYDDEDPELKFCQEPYMALLPSGRVIATMRVMLGYPVYSISEDGGRNWTKPLPLRIRPGGEHLKNVCGPCQISTSPDGRIYLLFSNRNDPVADESFWGRRWANRDPVHVAVGREVPMFAQGLSAEEANAGIYFDKPLIILRGAEGEPGELWSLSERHCRRTAAYPQLVHWAGKHYVCYANTKADIRIKAVPDELLAGYGIPTI